MEKEIARRVRILGDPSVVEVLHTNEKTCHVIEENLDYKLAEWEKDIITHPSLLLESFSKSFNGQDLFLQH